MNFSTAKIEAFVSNTGKYFKNHKYKFRVERGEDTDYLVAYCHYVLAIPKGLVDIDDTIDEVRSLERNIIQYNESKLDNLKYIDFRQLVETSKRKICVFKNKKGEEIWINSSFFTDFINGMFSKKTGKFADTISFTGRGMKEPILVWDGEDLVGWFLPINHVAK